MVQNPSANAGDIKDTGLILGSKRSPGEGNDSPLQYSYCRIPRTEEPGGLQSRGHKELDTTEASEQKKKKKKKNFNLASKRQMSFHHCNAQVHGFIHFSEHFWSKKNWASLQAFILSWRKGVTALER